MMIPYPRFDKAIFFCKMKYGYVDDLVQDCSNLVQDCSNSIANALDILQSCTKP